MPHVGRWRIHLVWHAEPFARPFDRGRRIPAFCILSNPELFVLPSLTVNEARALRSGYQPSSLLSPIPAARVSEQNLGSKMFTSIGQPEPGSRQPRERF